MDRLILQGVVNGGFQKFLKFWKFERRELCSSIVLNKSINARKLSFSFHRIFKVSYLCFRSPGLDFWSCEEYGVKVRDSITTVLMSPIEVVDNSNSRPLRIHRASLKITVANKHTHTHAHTADIQKRAYSPEFARAGIAFQRIMYLISSLQNKNLIRRKRKILV